ncbi:MAG: sulfite exporter TauE/SafE family protein [Gammaproteobacteria bacterium]|nr:sulfite exporter TauE/SafE family protein [Gammaproteobacteria bacterium]
MSPLVIADYSAAASALLLGLAGLAHCVGMCGGIAATLSLGLRDDLRRNGIRMLPFLLSYNLGRLASYALVGGIVGYVGAGADTLILDVAFPIGHLITAIFMLLAGLHVAGWWNGLAPMERGGGLLWGRYLQPLSRRLLPVHTTGAAFLAGCVWGWMPCGLVYAALVLAAIQADPLQGAVVMFCFGVGTLPALLSSGFFAQRLLHFMRANRLRVALGALVMALGVYALFRLSLAMHHSHPLL